MKKSLYTVLCAVLCLGIMSACSAGSADGSSVEIIREETASSDEPASNVVQGNQPYSLMIANSDGEYLAAESFSSYTLDYSDGKDKYMITITLNSTGNAFDITVEDNNFGYSSTIITAPENYILNIPYSQETASSVCKVIKNTIDNTQLPDILEFTFYLNDFEDESLPYSVTKYYAVQNSQLVEILIFGETETRAGHLEYCSESSMYHVEPTIFMPEPTVTFDENGNAETDISIYRFDPDNLTLTKCPANSTFEENPIYYGYAAKAIADNIAQYFTTTSLNVTDYENYVEMPSLNNSDINDCFFKVDDERFQTLEELKNFTRKYFSEKLVNEMFINAPQKYRDIDGALHTIVGDGGHDFTLGELIIIDYTVEGNSVIYHTRQEKFSDEGEFLKYIDGGDFVIELQPDGSFIVTGYRLSY